MIWSLLRFPPQLVALLLAAGLASPVLAQNVFIATPQGAATTEGDSSNRPTLNAVRLQFLLPASDFAELGGVPHLIRSLNQRADQSQTTSIDWTWGQHTIWMSTTQVDSLSENFAENEGPDKTLVNDSVLVFPLSGEGPANGPRDFLPGMPLDSTFYYDPTQGNLLIEMLRLPTNRSERATVDLFSTNEARIIVSQDPSSPVGIHDFRTPALLFEFSPVPEPGGGVFAMTAAIWFLGRVCRRFKN